MRIMSRSRMRRAWAAFIQLPRIEQCVRVCGNGDYAELKQFLFEEVYTVTALRVVGEGILQRREADRR